MDEQQRKAMLKETIRDFLANESYWANGIPFEVLKKSIENALCFGVYHQGRQVGFARVVTDYATTAYLGDFLLSNPVAAEGWANGWSKQSWITPSLQACACGSSAPGTPMTCTESTVSKK